MATDRRRCRSFVWPILLIGIGIIFLLENLGFIRWNAWETLATFWPLILILIGLDLILCRGNPWLASALAVVVVVLAIASGHATSAPGHFGAASGEASERQRLIQELGQLERATVELQFGAGDLALAALPVESGNLMEGDFAHFDGRAVARSFDCRGSNCVLRLTTRNSSRGFPFRGRIGGDSWRVNLSSRIPLDMRIQAGASRLNLDLSDLSLSNLRLDVGASNGTIKLPRVMSSTAVVKAGAADLTIEVPAETAAHIKVRGGLSSIQVDESRFPREGDYYVSPDFATATNRVDLDIDAGVASIKIR